MFFVPVCHLFILFLFSFFANLRKYYDLVIIIYIYIYNVNIYIYIGILYNLHYTIYMDFVTIITITTTISKYYYYYYYYTFLLK